MIINDLFTNKKIAVAEAGFPGAPDVEMPPMKPSGDPERDKLKKEYVDLHREIKSLVDAAYGGDKRAKARIAQLNDRADQIRAILEPRQPPNEWQKKTYGYDDNWNIVKKGVAEDKPRFDPLVAKIAAKMKGPTENDAIAALITVLGTSAYYERPGFYSLWLRQAIDKYNQQGVTETKKPSPKLTPVDMKKSEPVSEEINTEAYERLQKVFAFKNYES